MEKAVMEVDLPFKRLGSDKNKIREMYDLSEVELGVGLMVNTDRISTEDVVMLTGIPGTGKVRTKISAMMFRATRKICPNHFITDNFEQFPAKIKKELAPHREELAGRSMLILLAKPIKVEAIVRLFLDGSGYESYIKNGSVNEIVLPPRIPRRGQLPAPIFTPTTKESIGHDQKLTYEQFVEKVGNLSTAMLIKAYSLALASEISLILASKGVKFIDTKFEFGVIHPTRPGEGVPMFLYQIDETGTPDSSRYDPDYSKQPFREAMREIGFDGETPMEIPDWLVRKTSRNYLKMCQTITGNANY